MFSDYKIAIMPIGDLDTDQVKGDYTAILEHIHGFADDAFLSHPISNEDDIQQACSRISEIHPDLLVIIALRGRSAPLMDTAARTLNVPCLFWPVQGRFALPSSTLAVGALHETGFPAELLFAPPSHPLAIDRFQNIAWAARTYSRLRRCRIGMIGGLFPNLVSCRYEQEKLISKFGITLLQISFDEIRLIMQELEKTSQSREALNQKNSCHLKVDPQDIPIVDAGLKLHLALKQLTNEKQLKGIVAECWTGFPRELEMNPCLGFIEDAYTLACEGDLVLMIALLMIRYLTGVFSFVGDIYDLDLDHNIILVHCGAPASLAKDFRNVKIEKSCAAHAQGFETMTCKPQLEPGTVTLLRLYGAGGDQLHVALGDLVQCDTSPDLKVKIHLAGNRWHFLEQCFGNHYIVAPGDIREKLRLLCKWLGITVIET